MTKMTKLPWALSAAIVVLGSGLFPATAGDAVRGAALANAWCNGCHVPAARGMPGVMTAPPLDEIAQKKSGIGARTLTQSLLAPHPAMPNRGLSREEAEDIAAYLVSMRK